MSFAVPELSIPAATVAIPALRSADRARQGNNAGAPARRKRRPGISIQESAISTYHRSRGSPSSGWKPSDWQVFPKESSCTVLAIASQGMPWEDVHWVGFFPA
jgi:hypothetical protein